MKIGIIGHIKHPIAKPFAGGLEAFTDSFVRGLVSRGHDVTLFASGDSDPTLPLSPLTERSTIAASQERLGTINHRWVEKVEDESYETLMEELSQQSFDIVHNHSLSPIPLRHGANLRCPSLTTLHVPPIPRMVEAVKSQHRLRRGKFVSISSSSAAAWRPHVTQQVVIHNGVDTEFWHRGHRSQPRRAIWFGRIVPEKGTHLAMDAARLAGLALDIVGPIADDDYFDDEIRPRLNGRANYLGHAGHHDLRRLIGRASVALVTPRWEEPFGLVVVEALACGTPVAGFARGALTEIIDDQVGRLADVDDVVGLARAAKQCLSLSGRNCRNAAKKRFCFQRMIDRYENLYRQTRLEVAA